MADSPCQLASRLYGICECRGWSAESRVCNALMAAAQAAVRVDGKDQEAMRRLFD